jgi:carbonic anhydrase/acetyltransferase-like protein (isoleucine patch superfamily)
MPCLARRVTGRPVIAPLDEETTELLFGGETLTAHAATAAAALGLDLVRIAADEPIPAAAVAVVDDDVLFDATVLRRLLSSSSPQPIRQAAIAAGTALHRASTVPLAPTGDLAVPLWAGAVGGHRVDRLDEVDDIGVVVVADDPGVHAVDVRPYGPAPHRLELVDVNSLLGWPRHWLHVLELSLAALRLRVRRASPVVRAERRRGQRIHPTARVERSVLGDHVVVEAHAAVIDSVLGDDVLVGDHSVIHTSVIGPRCRTLVDTHLRRVVAMAGSTLSNLDMQDALFGREVFLTTGVAFFHDGPGRCVEVDGVDTGRPVLSGAIGRRAVLGSRALFRSGIALPAGALIVARPEEAIGRFDERSLAQAAMRLGDRAVDV